MLKRIAIRESTYTQGREQGSLDLYLGNNSKRKEKNR
jgi:hypothetical protein